MEQNQFDVIVVGAGFGGSTCAALLAKKGLRILLLDKNPGAGGKAMPFSKGKFSYNPFLICTAPLRENSFEAVINELGIRDKVKLIAGTASPVFRNASGKYVAQEPNADGGAPDPNKMLEWLELNEEEKAEAMKVFMAIISVQDPYAVEGLDDISFKEWLDSNHKVPAALYGFLAIMCDGAHVVPVDMVPASEGIQNLRDSFLRGGGLFCHGGVGQIASAFANAVAENGGRVIMNARVEKITVEDGEVTGVVISNGIFKAPIVVSNAGIQPTVLKLVGEEQFDKGYLNYVKGLVPSLGFMGIRYFLSRKVTKVDVSIVFSAETPWTLERWIRARAGEIPDDMPIWYEVPSNYDPEDAPADKQVLILGFVGPSDPKITDEEAKPWYDKAEKVLFGAVPGLQDAIESREYYNGRDVSAISRDQVMPYQGGECIGLGQTVGQGGKHKPSPKAPIQGLFYVGCDAGGFGVGTQQATDSGMKVADMVLRHHRLLRAR